MPRKEMPLDVAQELIRDARNNLAKSGVREFLSEVARVLPDVEAGEVADSAFKERRIGVTLSGPLQVRNVQGAVCRRVFVAMLPFATSPYTCAAFYIYCEDMVTIMGDKKSQEDASLVPLWSYPLPDPTADPPGFRSGIKEGIERAGFVPKDDEERVSAFNALFV